MSHSRPPAPTLNYSTPWLRQKERESLRKCSSALQVIFYYRCWEKLIKIPQVILPSHAGPRGTRTRSPWRKRGFPSTRRLSQVWIRIAKFVKIILFLIHVNCLSGLSELSELRYWLVLFVVFTLLSTFYAGLVREKKSDKAQNAHKFFCLHFPGNLLPPGLLRALHQVCPKIYLNYFRTSTTASIKNPFLGISSLSSAVADAASSDPEQQHHQPQLLPPSSRRASSYILPQATTNATTDLGDMSQHLPLEALEPPPPYKVVLASEEPPPSESSFKILSLYMCWRWTMPAYAFIVSTIDLCCELCGNSLDGEIIVPIYTYHTCAYLGKKLSNCVWWLGNLYI